MIGSAAGALIGLKLVVTTLIAQTPATLSPDAAAYGTPTTTHFGGALFITALLLAP